LFLRPAPTSVLAPDQQQSWAQILYEPSWLIIVKLKAFSTCSNARIFSTNLSWVYDGDIAELQRLSGTFEPMPYLIRDG
jgi:hypothetical protein